MPPRVSRNDHGSKQRRQRHRAGEIWLHEFSHTPAFYAAWYDDAAGQVRHKSLGTTDLQEAQIRLAQLILERARPVNAPPEDVPLAQILLRYYSNHAMHQASSDQARIACDLWNDFFEEDMVSAVTATRIADFTRELRLKKGFSGSYISRTLAVGRKALTLAKENREISWVPFIKDVADHKAKPRERRLDIDEMAILFEATSFLPPHVFDFCLIMATTLCRPDAARELTADRILFDRRLVKLNPEDRPQTKKYRPIVPLTNTLAGWMRDRTGHIVTYKGQPIGGIRTAWHTLRDLCGFGPEVIPYTVRHTMARVLRRAGVEPWEVSGMLGHMGAEGDQKFVSASEMRTTELYAQYEADHDSEARKAIDGYFVELQKRVKRRIVR
jgi:hypothetical protein